MTLDAYSTILVIGSIAMFLALLGASVAYFASRTTREKLERIPYERYIAALAAVSITSIVGSLIFQLVYETPVCELCWWQRIFLYPVSVISLVALWYKTQDD
jgi:ABC-type bacteriocin/lantibiotic exporter with double-glycine peptidase domain